MASKCENCRSTDVLTLHSNVVCCLGCGHTGNDANGPTVEPVEVHKTAVPDRKKKAADK